MKLTWPGLTEIPYVIIDKKTKDIYNIKNSLPPSLKHLNTTKNKYVELQMIQQLFTKEDLKSAMFVLYDLIDTFSADPFIEIPSKTHKKNNSDTKKCYVSLSTLLKFVLVWPACPAFKKTKNTIYDFLEDSSKAESCSNGDIKLNETSPLLGYSISMADKFSQTSNQYDLISTNKIKLSPANHNPLADQVSTSPNKHNTPLISDRITSESDSKSPLKIKLLLNGKHISNNNSSKDKTEDGDSSMTSIKENLKRKSIDSIKENSCKKIKINKIQDEISNDHSHTPSPHKKKEKIIKSSSKFHKKPEKLYFKDELSPNQHAPKENCMNNHNDKSTKVTKVMDDKMKKKTGSKTWILKDHDGLKVYASHLHVPSNIEIIRCTLKGCGQCFDTIHSADLHHLTHNHTTNQDNKTLTCNQCSFETSSNKWFLMLNHMMNQHQTTLATSPLTCQLCGLEFNSQQLLQEHFSHHYCNQYKCLQCGLLLHTWKQVEMHKKDCLQSSDNYSKSTYLCPYCPFVFHKKTLHRLHVSSHSDCGLQCISCQMAFPDWSHLRKHYKSQHPQLIEQYLRANNLDNNNDNNIKNNNNNNNKIIMKSKKDKKTLIDEVVQKRIADYFVFDNNKNNISDIKNDVDKNVTDKCTNMDHGGNNVEEDKTKLKSEGSKCSYNRDNNEVNDDEDDVSCVSNGTSQDDDYSYNNNNYSNDNDTAKENNSIYNNKKRCKEDTMFHSLSPPPSSSVVKQRRIKGDKSHCARTKALRWKDDDDYDNHVNNNTKKKNRYRKNRNSNDDYDEDTEQNATDLDDISCPVLSADDVTYPPLVDHLYFKYQYNNNNKGTVNYSFRTTRSQVNLVPDAIGPPEAHYVSNNDNISKDNDVINNDNDNNNIESNKNNGCDISAFLSENDHLQQQHVDVVVDNVLQQLNIVDEVKQQCVNAKDLTLSLDDFAFVCEHGVGVNEDGGSVVGDDYDKSYDDSNADDNINDDSNGDDNINNDSTGDDKPSNNNYVDYKSDDLIGESNSCVDDGDNDCQIGDDKYDDVNGDEDNRRIADTLNEGNNMNVCQDEDLKNNDINEDNDTKNEIIKNPNAANACNKNNAVSASDGDDNDFNDNQKNTKSNQEDGSIIDKRHDCKANDDGNDDNSNDGHNDRNKDLARIFVQSLGGVLKKND